MPQLTVALVPSPDQVVVRLTGDSDLSTAALLAEALDAADDHGTRVVVVDVARCGFWDCSGLHALADLSARLRTDDRECRLVGATSATRRLISMGDFTGTLELDGPVATPLRTPVTSRRRRPWTRTVAGGTAAELAGRRTG